MKCFRKMEPSVTECQFALGSIFFHLNASPEMSFSWTCSVLCSSCKRKTCFTKCSSLWVLEIWTELVWSFSLFREREREREDKSSLRFKDLFGQLHRLLIRLPLWRRKKSGFFEWNYLFRLISEICQRGERRDCINNTPGFSFERTHMFRITSST